jgi:putative transposase
MTQPRRMLIDPRETPYVHCVSRCVRRTFLFGDDPLTGRNFDHRRQWIVDKLAMLGGVFAIDVCAYAVMSNHYHAVLHVDADRAEGWDDDEVIRRWRMLFGGGALIERYTKGQCRSEPELAAVRETVAEWRQRLTDVSWFMRCLNEGIAREANREDGCKGRFREGRFKSQALLDETALLACMAYVDLNPIRAGIAETPEASDFTSIQARIRELGAAATTSQAKEAVSDTPENSDHDASAAPVEVEADATQPGAGLVPFVEHGGGDVRDAALPFRLEDYLELVDWTGRAIREDKRGFVPEHLPPILARLGIERRAWVESVGDYGRRFYGFVGPVEALRRVGAKLGKKWLRGLQAGRVLYAGWGCAGSTCGIGAEYDASQ